MSGTRPQLGTPDESPRINKRRRNEEGSVLIEFAFVSLLLIVQLVGIMEAGRAVWMYGTLAHATREGARYAIVRGAESKAYRGASWEAVASGVQDRVRAMSTGFGNSVTVTTTWDPAGDPACVPDNKPGCVVRVVSTVPYSPVTRLVPFGNITMSATSQMVISF